MKSIKTILAFLALVWLIGCKSTEPFLAYQGMTDQQIFLQANQKMQKRHYEGAAKDFDALETLYPFGDYSQVGQMHLIEAYYKDEDYASALAAADRYIRLYPGAADVDRAYYLKGLINEGAKEGWMSKWVNAESFQRDITAQRQAVQDFTTLIARFPNSHYVPEARRHLAALNKLLASHDLSIAKYYLNRKIYVAAINRANDVLNHYPESPYAAEALQVMVQSYRALNQPEVANALLRRGVVKQGLPGVVSRDD